MRPTLHGSDDCCHRRRFPETNGAPALFLRRAVKLTLTARDDRQQANRLEAAHSLGLPITTGAHHTDWTERPPWALVVKWHGRAVGRKAANCAGHCLCSGLATSAAMAGPSERTSVPGPQYTTVTNPAAKSGTRQSLAAARPATEPGIIPAWA